MVMLTAQVYILMILYSGYSDDYRYYSNNCIAIIMMTLQLFKVPLVDIDMSLQQH